MLMPKRVKHRKMMRGRMKGKAQRGNFLAYGDYGLVKTSYGYHVMFFVKSEPSWTSYAKTDWMNQQSADLLAAVTCLYPMEVSYDKIVLGVVELG